MRSKRPAGHCRGSWRRSTRTCGRSRCGGRRPDRGLGDVARQQAVAAPGEHRGEHADGAARLEGVPVPAFGELREADRVLALLVPAVLESPRVAGRLVHGVEVVRWQGDGRGQLSSTSCGRVKCATMPAGSTGPAPPPRSVSWLRKAPMADRFRP